MGFSKKRKNKVNPFAEKKRQIKENGGRKPEQNNRTGEYRDLIRESAQFEKYYKHQKVCPPEEWDQFMDALKSNLPTTFRVTSCRGESEKLLEIVRDKLFVEALKEVNPDGQGEHLDPPKSISWYPNESAFQLQLSRKEIRRSEPLFRLHNFLISETSSGNISRQEAVSMIPPIVLDVKSHHKVLDMCAAPGSKTAQLIEALHGDLDGKVPAGFVLANDVDNNRCYMLVHQAKRLNSPSCLITNCDSAQFPQLFIPGEEQTYKLLKFDRVLCDVPCTGDGTMRKNPDIWMKWNIMQSLNLHGIQFRIARRGAELCEVGGRLVYSTCSLNPIENEAVLCRLLKECNGSLKIIDASANIKTLKYTEGMTYWDLATRELNFYKTWEEVPENFQTTVRPEMFPPTPEEAERLNLKKCLRILPHQQDTGGFFVALLEKTALLPWEKEIDDKVVDRKNAKHDRQVAFDAESKAGETSTDETPKRNPKKPKRHFGFKEDPFVFFEKDEEIFPSIKKMYELTDEFPPENLLTRCLIGKKKHIYFCSTIIKNIIEINQNQIKLINSGVKTFSRCDNRNMDCSFRLAHEGLDNVDLFIGARRRIYLSRDDIINLLNNTDPLTPPLIASLCEATQQQLNNGFAAGSCILQYSEDKLKLKLVGWKGTKSLRAYTDLNDTLHMLRLLNADTSKLEKNKFKSEEEKPEGAVQEMETSQNDVEIVE